MTTPARAEDGPTPAQDEVGDEWVRFTEVEHLMRWKVEAMQALADWDRVFDALDRPGRLGESRAACALAEVARLTAALTEAGRQLDAVAAYADLETERANKAERERGHLLRTFYAECEGVRGRGHEHGVWCGSHWVALKAERDRLRAVVVELAEEHRDWMDAHTPAADLNERNQHRRIVARLFHLAAPGTNDDGQGGGE